MKKQLLLSIALIFILSVVHSQVTVINPLCENLENPGSLDTKTPRFSWQLHTDKRNILQTAYEIRVSDSKESLLKGKNMVWSSGKVVSDESVHIAYNGKPLESGKKYFWQVRVWDNAGKSVGMECAGTMADGIAQRIRLESEVDRGRVCRRLHSTDQPFISQAIQYRQKNKISNALYNSSRNV